MSGPATEKLYYSQPGLTGTDALVLEVKTGSDATVVMLDRTVFYPEGGGQPCDLGTIDGISLAWVRLEDGSILHALSGTHDFRPGSRVRLSLDEARRIDHTQQHSGQHLLSAVLEKHLGIHTVSFHLGADRSTIDVSAEAISREELDGIEAIVGSLIAKGLVLRTHLCPPEDAFSFPLRKKPPEGESELRIVEIDGLDWSPCAGTHVRSTLELRAFKILRAEKYKGLSRLHFVAGRRAVGELDSGWRNAQAISKVLECSRDEAPAKVESLQSRIQAVAAELGNLTSARAVLEARIAAAERPNASEPLRFDYADRDCGAAFETAKACSAAGRACVTLSRSDSGVCVQVPEQRPEWGPAGLGGFLKSKLAESGGKGGGGKTNFRATFPDAGSASAFADFAYLLLSAPGPAALSTPDNRNMSSAAAAPRTAVAGHTAAEPNFTI